MANWFTALLWLESQIVKAEIQWHLPRDAESSRSPTMGGHRVSPIPGSFVHVRESVRSTRTADHTVTFVLRTKDRDSTLSCLLGMHVKTLNE